MYAPCKVLRRPRKLWEFRSTTGTTGIFHIFSFIFILARFVVEFDGSKQSCHNWRLSQTLSQIEDIFHTNIFLLWGNLNSITNRMHSAVIEYYSKPNYNKRICNACWKNTCLMWTKIKLRPILFPKQVIENSVLFLHMRRNSPFTNHKYTEKNLSKIKFIGFWVHFNTKCVQFL